MIEPREQISSKLVNRFSTMCEKTFNRVQQISTVMSSYTVRANGVLLSFLLVKSLI